MDFLNLFTLLNTVIAYTILPEINPMTSALYIQGWITAPNPSMSVLFGLDRVSWSLAWLQTFYVAKNGLEFQLSYIYLSLPSKYDDEPHQVWNNIFIFTYISLFGAIIWNERVDACMPSCMYRDQKAICRNHLFPPTTRVSGIKLKSQGLLNAFTSEPPYSNICKCDSYWDISRKVLVLPKVEITKVN